MPTVGYATLQIIPSMRGVSDELRRQLVGPAANAGDQAGQAASGSLLDKLKVGAAAAGAAAGALLVKGLSDAMDQANVTSKLQAQLGTSNKVAAQQGKLAGKLYSAGVSDSFESAADAIKSVMQAGLAPPGATTKQLESLATKASDVANVFDQDLGGVTNAVSQMLRTGLAGSANEAFDVLTRGFQSGANKADDLLDTFNEYGTSFRNLGLSGKDAMGLLQQGLQGGARDADQVADAMKEFSLVASQGGKATEETFKSIGLNGKQMVADVAKGGGSAREALGKVLARLAELPSTATKASAVKTLFGGPGEDLGASLFALDLDKASLSLGKVAGAADKAGKTIRSGPSHEIEVFTRSLQQGFVVFLGGKVLPVVTTVAHVLNGSLVPALRITGSVASGVINWFREWGIWLAPLAILIGGLTLALNAQAIATGLVVGVMSVYSLASRGIALVTQGWAAAQALLNAVMALNPFVLVAIAVVALGAALVIAWKRSETFRSIVMAAWQGIQTAAMWAWTNVLKPTIDGLVTGWHYVAAGALWLWNTVLKPVFGFIATAAKIVATIYGVVFLVAFKVWWTGVQLYAGLVMGALRTVGGWAMWLWKSAISPVIGWIVGGFKLWWAGVQLYFSLVSAGFRTVGGWAVWLWRSAILPVVGWIVGGFKLMWAGVQVVVGLFVGGLKTVGSWAKWLWTNAVSPAMNGVRSVISTVWTTGIKPVFTALKTGIGLVGKAFDTAKDAIKIAWDKVKGIAKAPVQFVVNTVYGKLRGVWNTVAGAFGAPTLPEYKFASGGILPGYTPGRDVHMAALSGGEAIMRPEWTRAVGPGYVNSMNAAARSGGVGAIRRMVAGGMPAFADGGIFGWVKSAASKGVDLAKGGVSWLKDGLKESALAGLNKVVRPLINKISGSASLYRTMISGIPKRMIDAIASFSGQADKKLSAAGIGGGGFAAALKWARAQNGKPYIWGGVGPAGFDCSGFMGAIENVIRGLKPNARRWATGAFSGSSAPAGWVQGARSPFQIGITNAGVGHTAGTLNGVNVESRGGDGVVIGSRARGYNASLFTDTYGLKGYAGGGSPRPGEIAWVGENGPELIRFSGGEVVYSNADSRHIAAGLGQMRGFAKGTGSASARKQVPGDLSSFAKSLIGSASDISAAAAGLAKDLKAAGGAGKSLSASTVKASAKLQALAKQRDLVASRLESARQAAPDQKGTARDFLSASNFSDVTSVEDLIQGMKQRQATASAFQRSIRTLSGRGLNQNLIQQLVSMGPDSQLAKLVAGASNAEIGKLNSLASANVRLAVNYGNTMADAMFDAGKNASRGFLTGLQSQDKELQAAMNRLGDSLVSSIKKKLKIHSPSRVTQPLGAYTGQGFAIGLDSTATRVAAAAARVSRAAIPAVPDAAARAAAAGGLRPGDAVTLVVQDGPTLRAYVDARADERVDATLRPVAAQIAGRRG